MSNIFSTEIGNTDLPAVVFGHGWGRDHHDFIPVAEAIAPFARSILLDLPGFGKTPRPSEAWGTLEYANYIQEFISNELQLTEYIWVGHSFGGRLGLRLATSNGLGPSRMVIVAGAGLKRQKSILQSIRGRIQSTRYRWAKRSAPNEEAIIQLEQKFGSPDYVQSRELGLRDVFLRTIAEDQDASLEAVTCPTILIYGGLDTETPPEFGTRMKSSIPKAELIICPNFDHLELLDRGRHQIALAIKEAIIK